MATANGRAFEHRANGSDRICLDLTGDELLKRLPGMMTKADGGNVGQHPSQKRPQRGHRLFGWSYVQQFGKPPHLLIKVLGRFALIAGGFFC